jgi:hypothetical protein
MSVVEDNDILAVSGDIQAGMSFDTVDYPWPSSWKSGIIYQKRKGL